MNTNDVTVMNRKVARWLEETQERGNLAMTLRRGVTSVTVEGNDKNAVGVVIYDGILKVHLERMTDDDGKMQFIVGLCGLERVQCRNHWHHITSFTPNELKSGTWRLVSNINTNMGQLLACMLLRYGLCEIIAVSALMCHYFPPDAGEGGRLLPHRYKTSLRRLVVPFFGTSLSSLTGGCGLPTPNFPPENKVAPGAPAPRRSRSAIMSD